MHPDAILIVLAMFSGGAIAYLAQLWWEDEQKIRQAARLDYERNLHKQLLSEDYMSINQINAKITQLEKAQNARF